VFYWSLECTVGQRLARSGANSRNQHTATLLPNGKVLVAGGNISGVGSVLAELYDPAEGTWSAAPSLATARAAHTATLLSNGKLLLVGGFSTSAPTATAEIYW